MIAMLAEASDYATPGLIYGGGGGFVLAIALKMLRDENKARRDDNAARSKLETDLRAEFRKDMDRVEARHDAELKERDFQFDRAEAQHRVEIGELRSQINELRAEVRELKGQT